MKDMKQADGDQCPYAFNFDADTFKAGDLVSYRVPDRFNDFPFVGELIEVHEDHVLISPHDPTQPDRRYRGTRESRPMVDSSEID